MSNTNGAHNPNGEPLPATDLWPAVRDPNNRSGPTLDDDAFFLRLSEKSTADMLFG